MPACRSTDFEEKVLKIMDNGLEHGLLASHAEKVDNFWGRIWMENNKIWRIAFPAMLSRATSFGITVVTQAFIGHVSAMDLAAYALVQTILVRFADGILLGMSSATETLCGQSFGAKQYHMMGIYLQRSWIVDAATTSILLPLYFFVTPIFILLGQNEEIAVASGKIAAWFIPILYSFIFSLTIQMFLQAQQKNMIIGCLATLSLVLHVLLSWIFVCRFNWKVPGAMSAAIISSWALVFGEFIYIFGGWCPDTWKGFSKAAFTDLLPIVKLSISSGVMLCVQLWYSSVLVLLAGYTKNATISVSAFSICLNISTWEYMISLAFLSAACVRVSNEIGRGNANAAKFSIRLMLCTSITIGVVFWIIFLVFGKEIVYLFTSDEEVAEAAADLSVFLAFTMLLQSIQPVLSGVAIGCGMQGKIAIVNVCTYYVIGVPIGVLLAYVAHLDIKGIWIGMLCGLLIQALVISYITWKINWEEQSITTSQSLFVETRGRIGPKLG
ncbi:hypothetical protein Nepgr_028542 [Nepenthes gracilis]|uniref:Protein DETOXIFICATION n=1 Tax=Nepenthes gracilis TaxID=150966 RepID=A0AAD3Y481_NEPGR|nr:hypothetical protein Nepgr_028542 [Nepenthes gracilis]